MSENKPSVQSTEGIRLWLGVISFLVLAGSLLIAAGSVVNIGASFMMVATFGIFLAGLVFAALFWALIAILKQLESRQSQQQELLSSIENLGRVITADKLIKPAPSATPEPSPTHVAPAPAPTPVSNRIPEGYQIMPDIYPLLDALKEVRDIMLMSDDQRLAMRKQQELAKRQQVIDAVKTSLEQGMWEWAASRLAELPKEDAAYLELQQRISVIREEARVKAIHTASEQLHHLMAIGEWMRADEIITSIMAQFPEDPDVLEMRNLVNRERDAYMREQINHMFADLKAATNGKDWRRAHLLAEQLVSRYPNDPEISRLQLDLPTLKENSDAQERREEETLFKELLLAQRYDEALHVADRVMARFPGSPTAVELEKLLPKVRELAAKK